MVSVCAWCQRYLGSKEPLEDPSVSHGICNDCMERDSLDETPVLVVSPRRAEAIPMLQSLLRGAPEIAIVVDRRAAERRSGNGKAHEHARFVASVADRRATNRRRTPAFYLV
ncbi:MAG TPA: hypothetical protein VLL75_06030 [Vicinamibacteria bacterium]|nr:hypothetical protein [Vicinamibacteria bacterium]